MLDFLGRTYRVGPDAEELTGRPRHWMLWTSWAAMAAIGVLQYGFGSLVPQLLARGWSLAGLLWLLALWTVFQAGAGFPAAFLRERGRIGPRATMITGAGLVALGPFALAHGSGVVALLGYSVLSGTGAGLVYATCTSTVAKWYPERAAGKVSVVTGAFAYGSVPFAVAFLLAPLPVALDVAAVLIGSVVAAAGLLVRDPPADWWPPHLDPREWAVREPRAVRQYSAGEAVHTGVLTLMYAIVFCASAVSLFDVTFLALLGDRLDAGVAVVAVCTGLLLGMNGGGRALAIRLSERVGRVRTLGLVLTLLGAGQVCFAGAATSGSTALLVVSALVAGAGGGAFYPLFASLAREYFGERSALETHGVVYSAKAFGGVLGVGLAALATPAWGFGPVFLVAGALALGSAALCQRLRQPGRTPVLPGPATRPHLAG
ncbi:MFS transporter [Actinophytocola sp.]|uniref:MFS transporter n=1 Tax=Actinophytocola sp. TaxID=1872138 RepID=UPI002DDD02E5|nr:MFS transporter [Actinophytocola sp.]